MGNNNQTHKIKLKRIFCLSGSLLLILGSIYFLEYQMNMNKDFDNRLVQLETPKDTINFKDTDYYKNHLLPYDFTKEEAFTLKHKEYYILFIMNDCGYCEDLFQKFVNNEINYNTKDIYFYDIGEASSPEGFHWGDKEYDVTFTDTQKDVEIIGTPTMLKVTRDSNNVDGFIGGDAIVTELKK